MSTACVEKPSQPLRHSSPKPLLSEADFASLVRDYQDRLRSVAVRILRSEDDAADALQDALLSAATSLSGFQGHSTVYTWLYRIVVNACLMKLRSQRRARFVTWDETTQAAVRRTRGMLTATPVTCRRECHLEREERRALVHACIARLPEDYRTIVRMRDLEGFDTDQTAALLGITRGSAKTRLHRARQALRSLLMAAMSDA